MPPSQDFTAYRDQRLTSVPANELCAGIDSKTVVIVEDGALIRDNTAYISRRSNEMLRIFRDQLSRPLSIKYQTRAANAAEYSDICKSSFVLLPPEDVGRTRLPPLLASRLMSRTFRQMIASAGLLYVRMPSWVGAAFAAMAAATKTPLLVSVHGNWGQAYEAVASDMAKSASRRRLAELQARHAEGVTRKLCRQSIANFFVGTTLRDHYSPGQSKPEFTFANFLLTEKDRLPAEQLEKRLHGAEPRPFRIIFVGQFSSRKGLGPFLKAAEALYQEGLDLEVILVGEGELAAQLPTLAPRLTAEARLKNRGYIPYGPALLATYLEADVFVLPSVGGEGVPKVVAEAMAQGLPVVATDVGSTGELVKHNTTGLLVPPGSSPAIKTAISSLASDQGLRRGFAKAGWEASKTMTNDVQRRSIWEALHSIAPHVTVQEAVVR